MIEVFAHFGQGAQKLREVSLQPNAQIGGKLFAQERRKRSHPRINKDGVVVEDDDQVLFQMASLIQSFEGQARAQSPVADDGDDLSGRPLQSLGLDHSQRGGNRSPRMAGPENIVRTFLPAQKTAQSSELAKRRELLAPPADELVSIGLMAGVPHDPVFGGVKHVMQRQSQLYGAESRCQMPSDFGHNGDDLFTNFPCHLGKLLDA